jgi:hypothetical protein
MKKDVAKARAFAAAADKAAMDRAKANKKSK